MRAVLHPRLLLPFLSAFVLLCAAVGRAQDALPFGSDFLPTFGFSESYVENVTLGDFGYEQTATSKLTVDAKVSLKGVVIDDMVAADQTLSVTAGNLQMDLAMSDATPSVVSGRQVLSWEMPVIDPNTGEQLVAGTVTLSYTSSDAVLHFSLVNASGTYTIYALAEAGADETLENFPVIMRFAIGPYAMTDMTLYINGIAKVYDKTVGTGDNAQTFYNLANVSLSRCEVDHDLPKVYMDYPTSRTTVTEHPITVRGRCTDSHGVYQVQVQLNDDAFQTASLASGAWSLDGVSMKVGSNTLVVQVTDQDGHVAVLKRTVKFSDMSDLIVTAAGNAGGSVTAAFFKPLVYAPPTAAPVIRTKHKEGALLAVVAVPATGSVFDGWTANQTLTAKQLASPTLNFVHHPNLSLTAHFLINPFIPVKGRYNGLATGGQAAGDGFLTVQLAGNGTFSGSLKVGTVQIPLKGKFSNTGRYTRTLKVNGVSYTIDLTLNVSGSGAEQITGTATGGDLNVSITAPRAGVFNGLDHPSPHTGTYNVIIPPDAVQASLYPEGVGFGRAVVAPTGAARFTGRLGSGPAFNAGAQLSATGDWPFFAPLYGRRGCIWGPVAFDLNDPAHDLTGPLLWFKPSNVLGLLTYPQGFDGSSTLLGAKFAPAASGSRLFLNASSGAGTMVVKALPDGSLPSLDATLDVTIGTDQKLTVTTPPASPVQSMQITVNPLSGMFRGTCMEGQSLLSLGGIIVGPKLNQAAGNFRRGTQTGSIRIGPPTP